MDAEIYNALYTGENGEITLLNEVQLLDIFSPERIEQLVDLLNNEDLYIAYQATLILSAWGIDEGLKKVEDFIDKRLDKQMEFEPHRIYGEDNVYDVLAEALYISTFNTNDEKRIIPLLQKILSLYGELFFESRLKRVLLNIDGVSSISVNIEQAIKQAIDSERYYQASQLLPVLFKISSSLVTNYLPLFTEYVTKDSRIKYNLEEISY